MQRILQGSGTFATIAFLHAETLLFYKLTDIVTQKSKLHETKDTSSGLQVSKTKAERSFSFANPQIIIQMDMARSLSKLYMLVFVALVNS